MFGIYVGDIRIYHSLFFQFVTKHHLWNEQMRRINKKYLKSLKNDEKIFRAHLEELPIFTVPMVKMLKIIQQIYDFKYLVLVWIAPYI